MGLLNLSSVRLAVPAFHLPIVRFEDNNKEVESISRGEILSLFERELRGPTREKFTQSESSEVDRIRAVRAALYSGGVPSSR